MADKLKDSAFFGKRVISFAETLISSGPGQQRLDPITDFEKKLLLHQDELKNLNEKIQGGLIPLLTEGMDYVPPLTALRLLLYLDKFGLAGKGHELIYFAARDRLALSDVEVNQLVAEIRKDPESNIEWSLALLGGSESQQEEEYTKKNSLELPIDFK